MKRIHKTYAHFIIFFSIFIIIDSVKKYGSFKLSLKSFDFCKGPKRKDCALTAIKLITNTSTSLEITVTENVAPEKGKVTMISIDSNDTLRLQFNKPCENLFLKTVFHSLFNISSRCVVFKGSYKVNINFEDMLKQYYGGMHLYGTRVFKSVFYNNNCNFVCTRTVLQLSPLS